ncbi:MAG: nitrogen fixation protein NifZ [Gammaproteobacteria bacterium]|nr:MAG: nitrogen fixation protein NifZ [Gammaproteobacteria bacterium]
MRPVYEYGDEVRLIRNVRNDGTYPGSEVGELLMRRGSVGCVYDVGTYLQDQLIYRVHFLEEGKTVGCREEELIPASDEWIHNRFEFRDKVVATKALSCAGSIIVDVGDVGEIARVVRAPGVMYYHARFGERTFQVPEDALCAPEELSGEGVPAQVAQNG